MLALIAAEAPGVVGPVARRAQRALLGRRGGEQAQLEAGRIDAHDRDLPVAAPRRRPVEEGVVEARLERLPGDLGGAAPGVDRRGLHLRAQERRRESGREHRAIVGPRP
jgi:hypothetical protein